MESYLFFTHLIKQIFSGIIILLLTLKVIIPYFKYLSQSSHSSTTFLKEKNNLLTKQRKNSIPQTEKKLSRREWIIQETKKNPQRTSQLIKDWLNKKQSF